jgi:hypothetical protein
MMRVTKNNGFVAIGVPNFSSGPMIKARLLSLPLFRKIPGYRIDTEKSYTEAHLHKIFQESAMRANYKVKPMPTNYFGNALPMESPKIVLMSFGRILSSIFFRKKFLLMITYQVQP